MDNNCAVELRHITKRFGKVVANDSIDLTINRGEILSLLGENGSGKTTLMNMLAGIYFPDEGEIYVNGVLTSIRSPKDAFDNHIGMIHQHYKLVDVFTAAENIVLGLDEPGKLDIKAANARVKEICDRYGFDIDPTKKIYDMSVSQKQTVEIVKVLYRGSVSTLRIIPIFTISGCISFMIASICPETISAGISKNSWIPRVFCTVMLVIAETA